MTKYRLKKDLPDLEAGEIFDVTDNLDDETSSMFDSTGTYRFDKDDIKHFDEWFEEVKEPNWEKPEFDKLYYYVDDTGDIRSKFWMDNSVDNTRWALCICFITEKAAERYKEYLKAIATVRQDEGVLTPEQINELEGREGKAYHVGYMGKQNGEEVRLIDLYETWVPVGAILFDTEEHAEASLNKHLDDWKVIANYDWSRE